MTTSAHRECLTATHVTEGLTVAWQSKQSQSLTLGAEPVVVDYDDGGSGLLAACKARFASSGCEIACDSRHTVWVKLADGTRSVGLPPWQLSRHSIDELLERVDAKLGLKTGDH